LSSKASRTELCLYLDESLIPRFFQLLQQGFRLKVHTGCSIKTFLCDQIGLDSDYIERRIKTLFLDGKPVDDFNAAMIRNGSTLALSAAMPGLVGAVLRSSSFFASLRSTISHQEQAEAERPQEEGMVSLKIFNILLKEMGPAFLKKGIWIRGKDLQNFIEGHSDSFWTRCKKATLDGKEIELNKVPEMKWAGKDVFLYLKID
jgi:hypothetical protein